MEAVLQSEAAECGLACLAMIASAHGNATGLRELRRRHAVSSKGANLSQIMGTANEMHLTCRPLRLDMEHLGDLRLPCILHWDLNHFVVLTRVRKRHVIVLDPAFGKRELTLQDFSRHFTGIALELAPGAEFQREEAVQAISISKLTGRISGLWRSLAPILLLSGALQVFALLSPFFMQWTVDHALVAADRDLLTTLGIGFLIVLLIQVAVGHLRGLAVIHLSSRLGAQWNANVFNHLLRLPLSYFKTRHLGDITSRIDSVQEIQRTLTTSFVEALIDGLMAIVTLVAMLLYSWKLAIVTLLAVAMYLACRAVALRPLRAGTELQLAAAARQQSHLLESIRGAQSIKVAGRECLRRSSYLNLLNETINREVTLARYGIAFNGTSELIFGVERIAVIWIGSILAMQSVFSVGMLIAYLAYKAQFARRVGGLIDKWVEFRMLRLHAERLSDIVLTPPEEYASGAPMSVPMSVRIEVEGLSFRYAPEEPWVIRNLSMVVEPGESIAVVGASGCGKTTLMKLLLGLLVPTEGEIRIGGIPLAKIGMENYRKMVGAVMQDDQLFSGCISENIAFQEEGVDRDQVRWSAQLAAVHADIDAMPMGYNSLIGDMGTTLSGGQKQRLILARALYRKPRLLFLDEATSHLDVESERLVSEAVRKLDVTRVIIAHRPETIGSSDRVLVMDAGAIAQEMRKPFPAHAEVPEAERA